MTELLLSYSQGNGLALLKRPFERSLGGLIKKRMSIRHSHGILPPSRENSSAIALLVFAFTGPVHVFSIFLGVRFAEKAILKAFGWPYLDHLVLERAHGICQPSRENGSSIARSVFVLQHF